MQADYLIIGDVPPTFTVTLEKLWVEAPCYDRVQDQVIVVVDVKFFGKFHKTSGTRIGPEGRSIYCIFITSSSDSPMICEMLFAAKL